MQASYDRGALTALLPQNPPFLFLDSATAGAGHANGAYRITGEEAVGHFAGNPVFPASLMIEALGQLACAWLLTRIETDRGEAVRRRVKLFFVGVERIKCRRICVPGEVLDLAISPQKVRAPLAYFSGQIQTNGEKVASCETLSLSFGEGESRSN